MKKLIVSAIALSALLWVGCGGGDSGGGGGGGVNLITVTADTTTAPATPLVYNDPAWDNITATSISLSTSAPLPVGPVKSPLGSDKALSAPSSVDLQAIKKGGKLYLRLQWDDYSLSMQRSNWQLTNVDNFNFSHQTNFEEDQVVVLFENNPDSAWDLWDWRVLTTGAQNKAEDGAMLNGETVWDAGVNQVAYENATNDIHSPPWFPSSEWLFTGDIFYKSERIPRSQAIIGRTNWTVGQTVPGWWIDDEVNWATINESRWDVDAVYDYDPGIGIPGRYTLVMARDLTAHDDDVDMVGLARIKTRVGIFDNYIDLNPIGGNSQRKFSGDFWLALP